MWLPAGMWRRISPSNLSRSGGAFRGFPPLPFFAMTTEELFACADLAALHERAAQEVRKDPRDAGARALFVQVLCMEGDWHRAESQADALLKLSPASSMFCVSVGHLAAAERMRESVFAGQSSPCWMGARPLFADAWEAAMKAYGSGDVASGAEGTRRVLEMLPEVPVSFASGASSDWLLDGDARLAGVLELIKGEEWLVMDLASVASLEVARPSHPVEVLWPHVRLCLRSGEVLGGRMPGRYPVCAAEDDAALLMVRASAWQECSEGVYTGHGQRCWNTAAGLVPMLAETSLRFGTPVV